MFVVEFIAILLFDIPYNGHYGLEYAAIYYMNLSSETHIETENFIIEVPKFSWRKYSKDQNSFRGLYGKADDLRGIPLVAHVDLSDSNCSLEIIFPALCKTDPKYFVETINGWKAEIYECEDKEYDDYPTRFIKYKCESFWLSPYLEFLKPQYDEFFEGVRLKTQQKDRK
ncbi:MAG: hypothetical protein LBO72_01740 [Helicobacteraceae bacterium]|jgi:hypothetical protein|nr:hypothetical protein [Helicobacteraceae bacterium]